MKAILVNYNFTPDWLLTSGLDWMIYDRSDNKDFLKDFPQDKIQYTENIGNVDFDKLLYLYENYDTLPDVFLWGKTNLFKYISQEEYEKVKDNQEFTPLLTQHHSVYDDNLGAVCYYEGGMYHERNDNWYTRQFDWKYFKNYGAFAQRFNLPCPLYIPFAPGGNYILTREVVHKYSRDLYKDMADILSYARLPVEANFCERSYYMLWR